MIMTNFTKNITRRVEKLETVTKSVQRDKNMAEDIKQYQTRTDRRLNSLENKTCVYNVVTSNLTSLDRIQAALHDTRNILVSCQPNKTNEALPTGKKRNLFWINTL